MSSMNKEIFERFASLKRQEKDIKQQVDEVKVLVLKEMTDSGAEEADLEGVGKFVVVTKRTYTYPAAVVKMEEDLKKAQKDAVAKGDATYTDSPFIRFDALKGNE